MAEEIVREGMEVLGRDGGHVGTVDGIGGGLLRLTCHDDPGGEGQHRFLPLRLVAVAEAGQVRLTIGAQDARDVALGAVEAGGDSPEEDGNPPPGQVAAPDAGVGVYDMVSQEGGGSGQVHGGGTTQHGGMGLGDQRPHGGGTGGGGTTRHGPLGGGSGILDDPNMDPRGGRDPKR